MFIGKVVGNLWSTKKDDKLNGKRFLVIQKFTSQKTVAADILVAADKVGAGIGETVLVATGTNAKYTFDDKNLPIDMAIIGIIDSFDITE
ncbi:EutN/CcmL family microcompartment protein [Streptococcus ratti]|uniref:Ethanolamine utilization protein EutN/carboxysome structural protein Ccml n=1 Tax=Streptococcus ratti FA-1 = DSM 20564 TaxID=699248 RepID=A0ABN0GTJ9_STRRT|nr:EutN/CcmL family microcompartment protein [Streptococcus ratti]EJN93729.1 ethanolamine utilization protein EutN/carboxysome structural protein Ccml [Streptococcus ratti FA-1 = DSM 20564]EMP70632.1 ethanolamine utilization protein EutN/carboxysome structural protein Ccml [Streptococcus ratti FA-1 = DSM 20564]QEY07585.1 ethanolamine utilization protein EutN [Streptococcus ratti]VEI60042.1 ethanolamine utilization protein [Streptococcus mutans]